MIGNWSLSCCAAIAYLGENILQNYEELAAEFNIDRKVGHIATDNTSNMMRAFVTLLGYGNIDEGEDKVTL